MVIERKIQREVLKRIGLFVLSLGIGGQVPPWSSQSLQAVSEQRPILESILTPTPEPPKTEEIIYEQSSSPELPPQPTPENKLAQYRQEFDLNVKPIFLANKEEIENLRISGALGNLELLEKYYLIYRSAQEKFNVPWYLLWLIHDAESTISQNPEAFNPALHYGAMQRAVAFYPDSEVEEAAAGFEYLQNLIQNHPDDWKEILWAALKLNRDAWDAGISDRYQALKEALKSYSEEQEAFRRAIEFRILTEIFAYGV